MVTIPWSQRPEDGKRGTGRHREGIINPYTLPTHHNYPRSRRWGIGRVRSPLFVFLSTISTTPLLSFSPEETVPSPHLRGPLPLLLVVWYAGPTLNQVHRIGNPFRGVSGSFSTPTLPRKSVDVLGSDYRGPKYLVRRGGGLRSLQKSPLLSSSGGLGEGSRRSGTCKWSVDDGTPVAVYEGGVVEGSSEVRVLRTKSDRIQDQSGRVKGPT